MTQHRHTELRGTLDRLHRQLAEAGDLDAQSRAQLRAALHEIEDALRVEAQPRADQGSLGSRLAELEQQFEDSHPTLAEAVGRVVTALANLGI
jgi:hypothetical protein